MTVRQLPCRKPIGAYLTMKPVLIAIWLTLLLLNGCAQTGPKVAENAVSETQATDATTTEKTMLDQARAFRKTHPDLFGEAGGVLITGLVPGGQGEKIGLQSGDMLLTYDGNPLQTKTT